MNITDAMLDEYSDERIEVDDRPVLIDPGIYMGHMMNWEKSFNPMFRKYSLVMNFKIRDEVIPGWFNIEPSDSKTTVKAGWKSNFLRMYQGCLDIRLDRRYRISLAPFKVFVLPYVVPTHHRKFLSIKRKSPDNTGL